MIDDSGHQLGGINVSAAHLQKVRVALFKDNPGDFICIVDFAHRGDSVGTVVRADNKGLGFIIGNTSDAQISFHLSHIFIKLGSKRCVLNVMNCAVKTGFAIYGHSASAGAQMRMVVSSKKKIEYTIVLRCNSKKAAHNQNVLHIKKIPFSL